MLEKKGLYLIMKEAVIFYTERDFRDWFEANLDKVGVKRIILSQDPCPDYVVEMDSGEIAKIEAELFAINFKYHKHDPQKADYILACYAKEKDVLDVPVIALNKLWIYEPEPISSLPSEGPLSKDEIDMLIRIDFSGSKEISSLRGGLFAGDENIFLRVSPEVISAIPRGKIEDSIFNVITDETKEYIKKYHHILIGSGLSVSACNAIENLTRRNLIKIRPLDLMSALYDGTFIKHEGWVPTEAYLTGMARKIYGDRIKEWTLAEMKQARENI